MADLFRFDCQLELMCLANGENAVTVCCRPNQKYNETAAEATALTISAQRIESCVI
jgi:hypothetical protein